MLAPVSSKADEGYETRELSLETWPDFERLFERSGSGWAHCWCVAAQRLKALPSCTRSEAAAINRPYKRELVEQGRAHGILVYDADDEPVGWCQFGPRSELPILGASDDAEQPLWRVTCFVVDKKHRRRGVAGLALHAAIDAIRGRGGGVVEASPIAAWTHGPTGSHEAVRVQGVGPVAPAHGSFGNVSNAGTVSMFEKEGFQVVSVVSAPRPSDRLRAVGRRRLSGADAKKSLKTGGERTNRGLSSLRKGPLCWTHAVAARPSVHRKDRCNGSGTARRDGH